MSLCGLFEESCHRFPNKIALIQGDVNISYENLQGRIIAFASHLKSIGVTKGDRVAIMLPNCIEFVVSYYAAMYCGAIAVTLSVMATAFELSHYMGDCSAKVLIMRSAYAGRYDATKDDLAQCKTVITVDNHEAMPAGKSAISIPTAELNDSAVIIYTTGIVGKSVGAELTHGNLLTQTQILQKVSDCSCDDRALSVIPYFHSFGAAGNLVAPLSLGASIVLMERFTIDSIFSAIEKKQITYGIAVPRLYLGMLFYDKAKDYDIGSLRLLHTGGSAMPQEAFPAFEERFGLKLLEGYGLTETSPTTTLTGVNMAHKIGSVGPSISKQIQMKIVGDNDMELPIGSVGEVLIAGPNVMKGYWNDPVSTSIAIRNGWLYSGDLGYLDDDGYLFITGMKKKLILTNSFNVHPLEVETVLLKHPAVEKVFVQGKADALRGEIIFATIQLKENCAVDDKEIMSFCREYLSAYKVPREIKLVKEIA
ncbi:MAG: AMP-binding protein [Deltaproteobacteria bacterium]